MAMNKRTRVASESIGFLVILGAVLVTLNVFGVFAFARADLTQARKFSLSDGSKRVAHQLQDRMEVIGYFTQNLPPPFNATERYVKDLMVEYQSASGGKIDFKIVHPNTDELKQTAEKDGAELRKHQVLKDDEVAVKEGFRSIVLKYAGKQGYKKKVINVGRDTAGLEYQITLAMKQLIGDTRPVGILKGYDSASLDKELSSLRGALPTYELKEVSADELSNDLKALLIISPKKEIPEADLKKIDKYVMEGGSLGVFGGADKINMPSRQNPQPLSASPVDTGINRLLSRWGVHIKDALVADAQCDRVPMPTNIGIRIPVPYPPMPVLSFDDAEQKHPVLFRIDGSRFPFASALELTNPNDDKVHVEVLGRTSDQSWLLDGQNISLEPREPQDWTMSGKHGPFPVMVAIEGELPSAFGPLSQAMSSSDKKEDKPLGPSRAKKKVRVFVSGWGMDMIGQFLPQPDQSGQQQQHTNLAALTLNAIDWLAQESDLIAIRAKDVEDPELEVPKMAEARKKAEQAADEMRDAVKKNDRAAAEKAVKKNHEAVAEHKEAKEEWTSKKRAYRWGNTLGIPFAFALFGVVRWRFRANRKKNIKL